jgi:hypothetical protein
LRKGRKVVKLAESGLAWSERFTFYDQVHTTGMDIKQAVDACAAVTLGKDMVFRDYAQGTFRMRGIGKGQTICLIVVPEIDERIRNQVSISSGRIVNKIREGKQYLKDVLSWLVVNSMRVDGIQFDLLCEQNLANVWRKRAFQTLLQGYKDVDSKLEQKDLILSLQVFRERVDFVIENSVPIDLKYSDKISKMITIHGNMLQIPADRDETNRILKLVKEEENRNEMIRMRAAPISSVISVIPSNGEEGMEVTTTVTEQAFNREQVQEVMLSLLLLMINFYFLAYFIF